MSDFFDVFFVSCGNQRDKLKKKCSHLSLVIRLSFKHFDHIVNFTCKAMQPSDQTERKKIYKNVFNVKKYGA